ncbi:hypothetical protein BC827DRAFT_1191767 [Russula dissimulans]|nr:hypothetical protein BC827DRAFT_1191767 [Russula dissimulans]
MHTHIHMHTHTHAGPSASSESESGPSEAEGELEEKEKKSFHAMPDKRIPSLKERTNRKVKERNRRDHTTAERARVCLFVVSRASLHGATRCLDRPGWKTPSISTFPSIQLVSDSYRALGSSTQAGPPLLHPFTPVTEITNSVLLVDEEGGVPS